MQESAHNSFTQRDLKLNYFSVGSIRLLNFYLLKSKQNWLSKVLSEIYLPLCLSLGLFGLHQVLSGTDYLITSRTVLSFGFALNLLLSFKNSFNQTLDNLYSENYGMSSFYDNLTAFPCSFEDQALAELMWASLKSVFSVSLFIGISFLLLNFSMTSLTNGIPVFLLGSLLGASLGMITSLGVRSFQKMKVFFYCMWIPFITLSLLVDLKIVDLNKDIISLFRVLPFGFGLRSLSTLPESGVSISFIVTATLWASLTAILVLTAITLFCRKRS